MATTFDSRLHPRRADGKFTPTVHDEPDVGAETGNPVAARGRAVDELLDLGDDDTPALDPAAVRQACYPYTATVYGAVGSLGFGYDREARGSAFEAALADTVDAQAATRAVATKTDGLHAVCASLAEWEQTHPPKNEYAAWESLRHGAFPTLTSTGRGPSVATLRGMAWDSADMRALAAEELRFARTSGAA